ncbi:amidohydrolase, partial [Pectobacterium brasiliense]|nr:amidohydrolase [Pectobacterium brasiliense]
LIINAQGEILASAAPNQPACLDAELSLEALQSYRESFPAWRDADRFTL